MGWFTGGHLSPTAKILPLGSTAIQIARPPATTDVARPGAGRSSRARASTYANFGLISPAMLREVEKAGFAEGVKAAAHETRVETMASFIVIFYAVSTDNERKYATGL
mmetsp:Transcript_36828/g.45037  ORF Transcript_36828/g.45037 Transcript_36828/m.45037 type:complete len:108 (-) Transcript_36828:133-456(-)